VVHEGGGSRARASASGARGQTRHDAHTRTGTRHYRSIANILCLPVFLAQKLLDSPEAGPARNAQLASHWLHESARSGHVDSQFLLAQRSEATDPRRSFEWLRKAAVNGHAQAQYLVGVAFASNNAGQTSDALTDEERAKEAAKWFSLASEQGNVHAQVRLGFRQYHGVGVKQDKGTAIMWLNNAAEAVRMTPSRVWRRADRACRFR
jgi:TPR repeat protein